MCVARWVMQIQEYDFDIKYQPGQQMVHVDALSRNPLNERKTIAVLQQGDISTNNWRLIIQKADKKIQQIVKSLNEGRNEYKKEYTLTGGLLKKLTAHGPRWVVVA